MAENEEGKYRLTGHKEPGRRVSRLILEGTTSDPKRFVDNGGVIDLTSDEVTDLRKRGYELKKLDAEQAKAVEDEQGESSDSEPTTKKEQQKAQEATSGAQGPKRDNQTTSK